MGMDAMNMVRFDPDGPSGLEVWDPIDPTGLVSGEPVQRGHLYDEDPDAGYLAGVWDCTAFVDRMIPYSVDEFMFLLEGSVLLRLPDGSEVTVEAGQAFMIPKGLECQWTQSGYVRKFFMIVDAPVTEGAENPSLHRITVPDLTRPAVGDVVETARVAFVNSSGRMQVMMRDCAATILPDQPVPENRLIHVLSGRLTATQGGETQEILPGGTIYLKQGSTVGWQTEAQTRLLQASYRAG